MLAYKLVEDKTFNKVFREYYMTQGDTFKNQLSISYNGEKVTPELVKEFKFKLGNRGTNKLEYEQKYDYNEYLNRWVITIPAKETEKWEITNHVYEYEITYIDGDVRTLARAKFAVKDQTWGGELDE